MGRTGFVRMSKRVGIIELGGYIISGAAARTVRAFVVKSVGRTMVDRSWRKLLLYITQG